MRLNILYIIDRLAHGGTEKQLLHLLEGLDRKTYTPHICTLKPLGDFEETLQLPAFHLPFTSFTQPSLPLIVKGLVRYIRSNRIDIVQTFFQDPCVLGALSRPFHQALLVGSFRDLGFWRTQLESFKMRAAVKAYTGFIANSLAVKRHFAQKDRIKSDKIEVIYNGVDVPRFPERAEHPTTGQPPVVGIVANLNRPVKRVQDFIALATIVLQQRPEVRFMVIGDGHLRTKMENLASSQGVAEAITFVGRLSDPLPYLSTFAVGVITSETEGFSNAILEYMACGIPVVATATGGNLEVVDNGKNGFLVPVGDVKQLASRTLQVLQEPINEQIGKENKIKVQRKFSLPRMIKIHEQYYQALIQQHRPGKFTSDRRKSERRQEA